MRFEALGDQVVPAPRIASAQALPTADVEAVAGASHRDVEESVILVRFRLDGSALCIRKAAHVRVSSRRPEQVADFCWRVSGPVGLVDTRTLATGIGAGVRQNDNGRLQPFGTMYGHDPHFVAVLLHVALNIDLAITQLGNESL
jgi:hypothetical protein